ncbi:MAG: hypothetical protein K2M12_01200 [Muribaculaceae bacterium]|nr:hypothetical protein [Muribaculaceae bacterium]
MIKKFLQFITNGFVSDNSVGFQDSCIDFLKRLSVLFLCTFPLIAYAGAGFADRFCDLRAWLYPAYLYNLKFGIVSLIIVSAVFYIFREQLKKTLSIVSKYLESHSSIAILSLGLLLSIPIGIFCDVLYWLMWLTAVVPVYGLILAFPFILSSKRFRNMLLHSPLILAITITIVISAILASTCFILFTKLGWLSNTYDTYMVPFSDSPALTHPFDSVKSIWESTPIFIFETGLTLIFLWIAKGFRWIKGKIKSRDVSQH